MGRFKTNQEREQKKMKRKLEVQVDHANSPQFDKTKIEQAKRIMQKQQSSKHFKQLRFRQKV